MPQYTYICEINNEEFETEHSIKIVLEECPICKEKGLEAHAPKRLISCITKGVVQYTGHEFDQKHKEDLNKMRKEIYGNEKLYANVIGENNYNNTQSQIDRRGK
jgi:hypothetical protein